MAAGLRVGLSRLQEKGPLTSGRFLLLALDLRATTVGTIEYRESC
jgi:hypothetical protein